MTKHTSPAIALTVTTFLSAPAIAASLTPTLDNLKSEAGIVLPTLNETYKLTKLINNELPPEGAAVVTVGDKIYYFVPNGEYADLLVALAGTLKENENGLFELDGKNMVLTRRPLQQVSFHIKKQMLTIMILQSGKAIKKGKLLPSIINLISIPLNLKNLIVSAGRKSARPIRIKKTL